MNIEVKQALISVSDKTGLEKLVPALHKRGVRIISTGGTAKAVEALGVEVQTVENMTGQGELFGGRVKTLHPYIYAAILARPGNKADEAELRKMGLAPIDLVVVNLYPFQQTVVKPGVKIEQAIENIDIGGPSMIRASSKNHAKVAVVTDPADYAALLGELDANQGATSLEFRQRMMLKAFRHTAQYDTAIQGFFGGKFDDQSGSKFANPLTFSYEKLYDLRYGENSHQAGAFYRDFTVKETSVSKSKVLGGKQLSYNNIVDIETALEAVRDLDTCGVVILKHANPCGAAIDKTLVGAYKKAYSCDPVSAFGGIVGCNVPVDAATAKEMSKIFIECIIAPKFEKDALAILKKKKNLRLLEAGKFGKKQASPQLKSVVGGLLIMDRDVSDVPPAKWQCVTKKKPSQKDLENLAFAWKMVKWVKSNAILLAKNNQIIGVGAGQMNRVHSVEIAVKSAVEIAKKTTQGSYLASDAFFPFRDNVDLAAAAGVRAIVQPGGSIRDQEAIDACNEHGIIMLFTGMRHFRH
ncbi:bifunctional phosphoribosylaminoimidazolecarboxamide formyltransferase/IMP cyclohydrolase [Candidatus Sumerlaeota bacterium]|nr:bifunctional phosphoribosylaminoimidazolecarboxamide formyltransferase/IMP cyclohydrolase [Candidatus Sumerlaeota bacterium]